MKQLLRAKDYVRCRCGKLVRRENARKDEAGRWVGPECWRKAR